VSYLLDTSVLVRLANESDAQHAAAMVTVIELHRRNEVLQITAQNLIEFRNVATRPSVANGLGLSIGDAEAKSALFEVVFPLIPESPEIFAVWKVLVAERQVIGKQVHDARLVAVSRAAGVSHLLTFNVSHFRKLCEPDGPIVVEPFKTEFRRP
jgi:predicted nucleic acid-binding protein